MSIAPGVIIAAPSSGSGKTLLTLGLLRALKNNGLKAASFKVGPDYIDPEFHHYSSEQPCFNLDPWAMSQELLCDNYRAASDGSDIVIGEGVMGLFDGAQDGRGSTADLAALLNLPIILVVDGKGQSASMGALLHGFNSFREGTRLAGVIFNRVSSSHHAKLLSQAAEEIGIPTLGALPKLEALVTPSRHLGLVQASENSQLESFIQQAADTVAYHIDLEKLRGIAAQPTLVAGSSNMPPPGQRIAVAKDMAFSFCYPHWLHQWRHAGAEISFFSPLADEGPAKDVDFIYLPGGYPELHAGTLSTNQHFKAAMREAAASHTPIFGECGGYMTLGRTLTDQDGVIHEMLDLLPITTSFETPKRHLGYRRAISKTKNPIGPKGQVFMAHEFHYACEINNISAQSLFEISNAKGHNLGDVGALSGSVFGSFIHLIDRKDA